MSDPMALHNCTDPCPQCGGGCDLGHTVNCPSVPRLGPVAIGGIGADLILAGHPQIVVDLVTSALQGAGAHEPCAYCGSVNGETPSTAWHNDPLTGASLREAITEACELNNPRLSEVDWDFVAAHWSIAIVRDYAESFGLGCGECRSDVLHEAQCPFVVAKGDAS